MYFFLANTKVEHNAEIYSILDLLSQFGGFYGSIFQVLRVIGGFYNLRFLFGHLIENLYFKKYKSVTGQGASSIESIGFSFFDVFFTQIKYNIYKIFCCKSK